MAACTAWHHAHQVQAAYNTAKSFVQSVQTASTPEWLQSGTVAASRARCEGVVGKRAGTDQWTHRQRRAKAAGKPWQHSC